MDPILSEDEQSVRARLKRKWLLLGVFGWGLTMFVTMVGSDYLKRPRMFPFNIFGFSKVLFGLIIWLAGGYFWGLWMWHLEKRWRNL